MSDVGGFGERVIEAQKPPIRARIRYRQGGHLVHAHESQLTLAGFVELGMWGKRRQDELVGGWLGRGSGNRATSPNIPCAPIRQTDGSAMVAWQGKGGHVRNRTT